MVTSEVLNIWITFRITGIDVLYMTPIFKSYSSHKYDIIDYYQIESFIWNDRGSEGTGAGAHKRGMKSSWMQCSTIQEENFAFEDIMEKEKIKISGLVLY